VLTSSTTIVPGPGTRALAFLADDREPVGRLDVGLEDEVRVARLQSPAVTGVVEDLAAARIAAAGVDGEGGERFPGLPIVIA
jgi:hypothetical protein